MGCGCSEAEGEKKVQVGEDDPIHDALHHIAHEIIEKDKDGEFVKKMYEAWKLVLNEKPKEVTMKNGEKRMTWPITWIELEHEMAHCGVHNSGVHNMAFLHHYKALLVDNVAFPHITEHEITWPAFQNVTKLCFEELHGKSSWKPTGFAHYSSHLAPKMNLQLRMDTLTDAANMAIYKELIEHDPVGAWVQKIFEEWPIEAAPEEVQTADGMKVTWPLPWAKVAEMFEHSSEHINPEMVAAVHQLTVDNTVLPHITDSCMTWPAFQNALKKIHAKATGADWNPADHKENYTYLVNSNSLKSKVEGFDKMIKDKVAEDEEKFREEMWAVFGAWPINGDPAQVTRSNRKAFMKGITKDAHKETWPLPFEGDESVTSVLEANGWTGDQVMALSTALFEQGKEYGIHANCTKEQVCWPDIQQACRGAVCGGSWEADDAKEWPCLDGQRTTLRNRMTVDEVKGCLIGSFRMYCLPEDGDPDEDAFSYGLIVEHVDFTEESSEEAPGTFTAKSKTGAYSVPDGKVWYDTRKRVWLSYTETWENGACDFLCARLKSNAKFVCDSDSGYEQKARNENVHGEEDPESPDGGMKDPAIAKYYNNST